MTQEEFIEEFLKITGIKRISKDNATLEFCLDMYRDRVLTAKYLSEQEDNQWEQARKDGYSAGYNQGFAEAKEQIKDTISYDSLRK